MDYDDRRAGASSFEELQRLALADVRRIEAALLQVLPARPSRWSGVVEIDPTMAASGTKPFSCDIRINPATVTDEARWRSYIHELLHARSEGYEREAFLRFRGWEEGVVEQLQRLIRSSVLQAAGIQTRRGAFIERDANHPFRSYMAALETIRLAAGTPRRKFYEALLATPITDRRGYALTLAERVPQRERDAFRKIILRASGLLR